MEDDRISALERQLFSALGRIRWLESRLLLDAQSQPFDPEHFATLHLFWDTLEREGGPFIPVFEQHHFYRLGLGRIVAALQLQGPEAARSMCSQWLAAVRSESSTSQPVAAEGPLSSEAR
jgi:hypothetical protein